VCISLKTPSGVSLIQRLAATADVVIDPFRPGVLDKHDLGPSSLRALNPRLVYARLSGFRRSGKYAHMAGHDINYLAVSGVLALLGRSGEKPYAPANLLADFAGGGLMCFVGILLALLKGGGGEVVDVNMVDGAAYLAAFPRAALFTNAWRWSEHRGEGLLDGGAPWYDTYETSDGKYMAV
jgi:alpha-methylacyl-CoA racemase